MAGRKGPRCGARTRQGRPCVAKAMFRFALWGKNLTDEEYRVYGITAFEALGFAGAVFNEPRSYGLDIIFDYD